MIDIDNLHKRYRTADGGFDRDRAENGPWSACIPGLPAAFVHIAERYGALPLSQSLAPAIRIAEEGFPVYARFARGYRSRRAVMERYPGTRAVFLADGRAPEAGDIFRQPDLARTLRLLAERGFDGFYGGETGAKLVAGVNAEGGEWTAADLAAYRVVERTPIRFRYHDWEVVTAPPPRLTTAPTPFSRARRTPRSISCRSGSWAIDSVVTFSW